MSSRLEANLKRKSQVKLGAIILSILVLAVVIFLGIRHYIYSVCNKYNNVIFPGVKIESLDVGGKSKSEAIKLVTEHYGNKLLNKNIIIKAQNKEYKLNYAKLDARYNIDETVNKAFMYGRDKGIIEKYKLIKKPIYQKYNLKFKYDGKYIDVLLNKIKKDVYIKPKDASITKVGGDSFSVTEGKNGQLLDEKKLKDDINKCVNGDIKEDKVIINAKIDVKKPKIEAGPLKTINSRISTFSTKFNSGAANRSYNIKLASNTINGTVIMPGQVFSFNGVVGERTDSKGYKGAPVIIGNKVEKGLGGGICQVSSTLYNAVIRANLPSTERANHTMPSSYVPKGLDATVSYGSIDYKFKDTLKYPVYIESYVSGDNIICSIYSNNSLKEYTYNYVSEIESTVAPHTTYINDSSLPRGTEVVDVSPKTGYKVKVYKITYKNGQQVSKELFHKDFYKPINGVIKKGTK